MDIEREEINWGGGSCDIFFEVCKEVECFILTYN